MIGVREFLAKVEEIAAEEPGYQLGHYGQDNLCDCIGLIIGAIRRAGGQWRGLHGSNYAARSEIVKLGKITGTGDLTAGELVFKAREPGTGGYDLPDRYLPGGQSYNGDLKDYYHVGVVISVYPLRIRHMTKPQPKMDATIGKWEYHGWPKKISKEEQAQEGEKMNLGLVVIYGGATDQPVHMRSAGSRASAIIADIPQGSVAELIEGGGAWNRVKWSGKIGYVMSEFVHPESADGEQMISVSRAELEKAYDIIGDLLGMRG